MNECFIIGKILSEIRFNFVLNSKNISIVEFELEVNNKSIIEIIGYNEIADFCYSKLVMGDMVSIYGKISNNMKVVISEIYLL